MRGGEAGEVAGEAFNLWGAHPLGGKGIEAAACGQVRLASVITSERLKPRGSLPALARLDRGGVGGAPPAVLSRCLPRPRMMVP